MSHLATVDRTLEFLAEHTRDVIVRGDPNGLVTYVSPSIRMFGYEPEALLGTTGIHLIHPDDQARFWRNSEALMRGEIETPEGREHRFLSATGEWVWMEGSPMLMHGDDGEVTGFVNVFRDISHRRELEAQAHEHAELFEAAFRDAAIGVALISLDGRFLKVNPAFSRIMGRPMEAIAVLDIRTITHPDDMRIDRDVRRQLQRGEIDSFRVEKRYLRPDGEYVLASVTGSVVRNPDGSPKYFVSQVEDLTEQTAARAALTASEARYRLIADNTSDVIVITEVGGLMRYISPAVRRIGYEPEALIGRAFAENINPDDQPVVRQAIDRLKAGGSSERFRYRARHGVTGEWLWMESNCSVLRDADGAPTGFLDAVRDVTPQVRQEEQAREQAELFAAAFRNAPIGKALVGLDGTFLEVNPAFCKIVGRTEDELQSRPFEAFTHPEHHGEDLETLQALNAGEIQTYRADKRFLRPDGGEVWVRMAVSTVPKPDGAPMYYVAQYEDLTETRAAEAAVKASEARYRLIAENTSDMIVMSDNTGAIRYISPAVRQIGHEPAALVGKTFRAHMHPDDMPAVVQGFQQLRAGGRNDRMRWRGRNGETGEWVWLESNASPLIDPVDGRVTGVLDVVRDVTQWVSQGEALATARAEAEAATAAKSQFLANMSHEIRTPLTAVLGFTGLLNEMPGLDPVAARYVSRIAAAGNGLLALVNDILDFSKLEAGMFEVRPQPTDAAAVCEETLQLFTSQAEAKGLALAFQCEAEAHGPRLLDGDRLRQTLINLVGNAVKVTEAGSVTLALGAGGADQIVVEVRDTGPGLDDQAQAMLFQRFSQVDDSMTRQHGGTGLGLAICKGIAEAMGGTISVESRAGEGAIFRLVLPAPPAELPQGPVGETPLGSIEGARVFVVDDNGANRELARRVLEAAGAQVTEASDGTEALERLAAAPVDVVLMDLRMPGLDGRQTLAELRARAGVNREVPVLAFTADADVGAGGDLAGFDGLVRKPIQPLELYGTLAEALAWSAEEPDLAQAAAR